MKHHENASLETLNTSLYRASLALFALLLALTSVPAAAEYGKGVTIYEDVHFRGHCKTFRGDVPDVSKAHFGNDRASSIEVPRGCRVTLYRDVYFRGRSITLDHDSADLGYTRIGNDEVSSLSVDCGGGWTRGRRGDRYEHYDDSGGYGDYEYGGDVRRPGRRGYGDRDYEDRRYDDRGYGRDRHTRGVTVYSDANFRGRSEHFNHDDRNLRDNRIGNDTISSIVVAPGCQAVLYSNTGFRGTTTVLNESFSNLRYASIGNDRVSSIRVDCGSW